MQSVAKNIGSVTKSLESAMASLDLEKVSKIMEQFEKQFEDLDVKGNVLESTMSSATTLTTPMSEVESLIKQVAEEHGLEQMVKLDEAPSVSGLPAVGAASGRSKAEEDALTNRLAALRN